MSDTTCNIHRIAYPGVELYVIQESGSRYYTPRGRNYLSTIKDTLLIRNKSELVTINADNYIYQDSITAEYIWVNIKNHVISVFLSSTMLLLLQSLAPWYRFLYYSNKYIGDNIKIIHKYLYRIEEIKNLATKYRVNMERYFSYIDSVIYTGDYGDAALDLIYSTCNSLYVWIKHSRHDFRFEIYGSLNELRMALPNDIRVQIQMTSSPSLQSNHERNFSETVITAMTELPVEIHSTEIRNLIIYTTPNLEVELQKRYPNAIILTYYSADDTDYVMHQFLNNNYNTRHLTWCRNLSLYENRKCRHLDSSSFFCIDRNDVWDLQANLKNKGLLA